MRVQGARAGLQLKKSSQSTRLEYTGRIHLRELPHKPAIKHSSGAGG